MGEKGTRSLEKSTFSKSGIKWPLILQLKAADF